MTKRTQALQKQSQEATKSAKKAKQRGSGIELTAEMNESDSDLSELSDSASEGSSDSEDGPGHASEGGVDADGDFDMEDGAESRHGDSSDSDWEERLPNNNSKVSKNRMATTTAIKPIFPAHVHPFDDLSTDLLINVISYLEANDVQNFSLTSKCLYNFACIPSIRAEWLAGKYPRNELLYQLVQVGGLANSAETIDKITIRQPISRYFIQCLFKAKAGTGTHYLGNHAHKLPFVAFSNFLAKGAALYGNDLSFRKTITDADYFKGWIASNGTEFKALAREGRRPSKISTKSVEQQKVEAFAKVEELFLINNFSPFSPIDPVWDLFPAAFSVHAEFYDLLVKAKFLIDDKMKEGLLNHILFNSSLNVQEKITKFKFYGNTVGLMLAFSEDHLFHLLNGCSKDERFLGVENKCLNDVELATIRQLERDGQFRHSLCDIVVRVMAENAGAGLYSKTAHIIKYLQAYPEAALDSCVATKFSHCVISTLHNNLSNVRPDEVTCAGATVNLSQRLIPADARAHLLSHNIAIEAAALVKTLDVVNMRVRGILTFAVEISASQSDLQRSLLWTLLESPGYGRLLREALELWPQRLAFVKQIILDRNISKERPSEHNVTALGKPISRKFASIAPFTPEATTITIKSATKHANLHATVLLEWFKDDAEVLVILLTHAALNSNSSSVLRLLDAGVEVSFELFEILAKAQVAPLPILFCALRRQPFRSRLADCTLSTAHLEPLAAYRDSSTKTICRACFFSERSGTTRHDNSEPYNRASLETWIGKLEAENTSHKVARRASGQREGRTGLSAWSAAVDAFLKDAKATLRTENAAGVA